MSRVGKTIVSSAGIPEMVAKNKNEYGDIAIRLAENLKELSDIRAELRPKLLDSTLCDSKKFTYNLEYLYRDKWKDYCSNL